MRRLSRLGCVLGCAVLLCLPSVAAAGDLSKSFPPPRLGGVVATAPALLETTAVPIRADRFGESLQRAHEDASRSPLLQRLITPARGFTPLQQIGYVQHAVATAIRWESDATQWGQHDYWATASQTLERGAGDMEDRAIVKMQALRALGFSSGDLFLTLARDRVGGPETVLTVRSGGHYYVLDDTGGTPFPIEQRRFEFQPIISFGWNGAWMHIRPTTATASLTARPGAGSYARR